MQLKFVSSIAKAYGDAHRARRAENPRALVAISPETRMLDLGGGAGAHVNLVFPGHANIVVADISPQALQIAESK